LNECDSTRHSAIGGTKDTASLGKLVFGFHTRDDVGDSTVAKGRILGRIERRVACGNNDGIHLNGGFLGRTSLHPRSGKTAFPARLEIGQFGGGVEMDAGHILEGSKSLIGDANVASEANFGGFATHFMGVPTDFGLLFDHMNFRAGFCQSIGSSDTGDTSADHDYTDIPAVFRVFHVFNSGKKTGRKPTASSMAVSKY
jgi:hypothetical protein